MDIKTAETISKKTRALKHCDKLLGKIDRRGKLDVPLNSTGVVFTVTKGDAIYLRIQSLKFNLLDQIHSMEVASKFKEPKATNVKRTAPAPYGASTLTPEETLEIKKEKARENARKYYLEHREERLKYFRERDARRRLEKK